MTDQLLQLELRLLILRHGRRKVIEGLAGLGDQTIADVERDMSAVAELRNRKQSKPKQVAELIAEFCGERPEVDGILRTLAARFEAKTLLPQLRDVERFLDRVSMKHGKLKSRRDALPHVIRAFAQLPIAELKSLAEPAPSTGTSDFALLAREIMGGRSEGRTAHSGPEPSPKE